MTERFPKLEKTRLARFNRIAALILSITTLCAAQEAIPASERAALLALFDATQGESWKNTGGWISPGTGRPGPPGTECHWEGVTCDNDGRLSELNLAGFGLAGALPASIGGLGRLDVLNLSNNRLSGQIPSSLFQLKYLRVLNLSNNRLRGSLPASMVDLGSLESMNLSRNYLSGSIEGLGTLSQIEDLDLSNNRLQGPLSKSLTRLTGLQHLNLAMNALSGPIPAEIGEMGALEELVLTHNLLTGSLPAELGKLGDLRSLEVSYNHLSGPFPSSLAGLENLGIIGASHNSFGGSVPVNVCQDWLDVLDLSWNHLSGSLPPGIAKCSELTGLILAHNELRGTLPTAALAPLKRLGTLDLSANHLEGPIPAFKEQSQLVTLNLSDNGFSGDLAGLAAHEFQSLRLDRNGLSGPIPAQLTATRHLTLSGNRLSGSLPERLCSLSELLVLDLSHNHLTGRLCGPGESAGGFDNLVVLNLSFNQLDGPLPPYLFGSKRLTSLFLSNNRFGGSLPQESDSTAFQILDLSHNRFQDPLPEWVEKLPLLRWVDLRENRWAESLPKKLVDLQKASAKVAPPEPISPWVLADASEPREANVIQVTATPPVPISVDVTPIPGQAESSVSGTVIDIAGAVVPGAKVVVESAAGTKTTITDSQGHYQMTLPAGEYRLTCDVPGFKKTETQISVTVGTLTSVDLRLAVGTTSEQIEVISPAEEVPTGPWWNTWIARKGVSETARERTLKTRTDYSFYLELSGVSSRDAATGSTSKALSKELKKRLVELASDTQETELFVRISVIGRAAGLSGGVGSVKQWTSGAWVAQAEPAASGVLIVDLTKLLPTASGGSRTDTTKAAPALSARGGAILFGIRTGDKPGCAAIVVSIWDDSKMVPLDHLVYTLQVGSGAQCDAGESENQTAPSLYSHASRAVKPDVSLHVIEFSVLGELHSSSFMVLRKALAGCESYHWDSAASLTRQILNSDKFKSDLGDARAGNVLYSVVGQDLKDAVFSETGSAGKCGSAPAFEALKVSAQTGDVHLFARVSDDRGGLSIVPLGLLAMYQEAGKYVFAHDIRLMQPVALETLEETECVGNWTFVLPPALEGISVSLPPWVDGDPRVLHSKGELDQFLSAASDSGPTGLLLLAHHQNGFLTFETGQNLFFTAFNRELGPGSIAILSACETGNLTGDTALLRQLNGKGADAMVATAFELDQGFGVAFASNFADQVAHRGPEPMTLEQAFNSALAKTVSDLSPGGTGDLARGMSLELVLAGNPSLKICGVKPASSGQQQR